MTEKALVRVAAVQIAPDLDTPGGTVSKVIAALSMGLIPRKSRAFRPDESRSSYWILRSVATG